MATKYYFGGKTIMLPGAYAETKALVATPATPATYGKVLVIDTGSNAGWGSGSGVNGEFNQGVKSVYTFDSPEKLKSFVKGGVWYNLADALFTPSRATDVKGVSEVIWISAKTSTSASLTLSFPTLEKTLVVKTLDEGTFSNGVEYTKTDGSKLLTKGYCVTAHKGVKDISKIYFKFWVSTFTGFSSDNLPFNEIKQEKASPSIVAVTPEVSTLEELVTWMKTDYNFSLGFKLTSTDQTGVIPSSDITTLISLGNQLFSGGTETYENTEDFERVLTTVATRDCSFLFSDLSKSEITGAKATRLQGFCQTDSRFPKPLVLAGGETRSEFSSITIEACKYFDSDLVWVVQGSILKNSSLTPSKQRSWSSLFHAAFILGRIAGLSPEVPPTWKELDIKGLDYELDTDELKDSLNYGVLTSYWDEDLERYCILKGVNTLQNNDNQINPDGTTPSIQIKRIECQVNKELVLDAKKELCSQRNGVNVLTVSSQFLRDWTIEKLTKKIERGLLTSFENVKVEKKGDAYFTTYEFKVNEEINFFFSTGYLLEN